jgi:hypothetical protein
MTKQQYLEGDMEKKDSLLYNIKKNYGYDINRNSGFNKNGGKLLEIAFLKTLLGRYW